MNKDAKPQDRDEGKTHRKMAAMLSPKVSELHKLMSKKNKVNHLLPPWQQLFSLDIKTFFLTPVLPLSGIA